VDQILVGLRESTSELFIRWFEFRIFAFFRTHSSISSFPREPWSFGEPYTTIARKYLTIRYQLLPYWYSLAWQAKQTGTPLVKPLFWLDPLTTKFYNTDDAFILGDALLVAPVLEEGRHP
jgi:alpha-glucosidase